MISVSPSDTIDIDPVDLLLADLFRLLFETAAKAKALYDYSGASAEEAGFAEGDTLNVVDQEDANWWRVDVGGPKILVAPATYLELSG